MTEEAISPRQTPRRNSLVICGNSLGLIGPKTNMNELLNWLNLLDYMQKYVPTLQTVISSSSLTWPDFSS